MGITEKIYELTFAKKGEVGKIFAGGSPAGRRRVAFVIDFLIKLLQAGRRPDEKNNNKNNKNNNFFSRPTPPATTHRENIIRSGPPSL